jgi:molybdopterin converting factor small subunit
LLHLVFLGRLRDLAGGPERQVASAAVGTVAALIASLEPQLADELASERVRVALNGTLASRACAIADGDEIAFLPPVSGG